MIPKSQLLDMFAQVRSETDWNLDSEMLWSYYFTNSNPEALLAVADELAAAGYRVVEIRQDDNGYFFWLHIEKVETHSPDTLHKANQAFYRLANKYGLQSYDGMDVGPIRQESESQHC